MLQKSDSHIFMAKHRLRVFHADESCDVNIVLLIALIGVTALLAIAFKYVVWDLLRNFVTNVTQEIQGCTGCPYPVNVY